MEVRPPATDATVLIWLLALNCWGWPLWEQFLSADLLLRQQEASSQEDRPEIRSLEEKSFSTGSPEVDIWFCLRLSSKFWHNLMNLLQNLQTRSRQLSFFQLFRCVWNGIDRSSLARQRYNLARYINAKLSLRHNRLPSVAHGNSKSGGMTQE